MKIFYSKAQWWSKEKIESWQMKKLKEIVNYSYENVPGYFQLYKEACVKPEDINTLADINKLPFTDKELIRDNLKDFTSKSINRKKLHYCTTGGSTGIPFGFYYTKENYAVEYGFMHNAWEQTGWKINDLGIILRGSFIGSENKIYEKSQSKRYNLSSYYLTEKSYHNYRDIICKIQPVFLHAYPSIATDLAKLVIQNNDINRFNIKSIFLGSENLYEWQKEIIKTAFPTAKLMSWYGHTEMSIWAPWCEKTEKFHVSPFYGLTEILDSNNNEVNENEIGELVGTSFWMKATPFIRYKTMDHAEKGKFGCYKCGRKFQLLNSIDGRLQEIIISKKGRRISMTAINMHDETFNAIRQFRFVQNREGHIKLKIVPKADYNTKNKRDIFNSIMRKLGDDFDLDIVEVDALSRTKSGKYSFLQQNLDIERSYRN